MNKLTEEQIKIVNCDDKMIVVNALSGVGKTSTLVEWCRNRPHLKILYLVFGKSMSDEGKIMFKGMKNVEVRTTHSLAFKGFGAKYKSKLTQSYKAIDCMRDLGINGDYDTATDVLRLFNKFLASNYDKIDDFVVWYLTRKGMRNENLIKKISHLCLELWNESLDVKSDVKVTHDFYLKLYQLSKPDLGKEYNVLILDEAQDLSYTIKSLIDEAKSANNIVIIGDKNQAIYKFRGCVNILEMYPNATQLELTGSFRVNQDIASMCSMLIGMFKNKKIDMMGYNQNQKIYSSNKLNFENMQGRFNIITRTNATILAHALEASSRGMWLFFEGGVKSYPFQFYKDLFWFRATNQTMNRELKKFKDWRELQEYAEEAEDVELLTGINFINIYSKKFDSLPKAIDKVFNYVVERRSDAQFCYCTAHKSKGLTFHEPVLIESDFPSLIKWSEEMEKIRNLKPNEYLPSSPPEKQLENIIKQIEQEVNLIYVAMTRAKSDVYFNEDLYKFFNL